MINIKLDLAPDRTELYEAALSRLRGVELAGGSAPDALITGDGEAAGASGIPCLLDHPASLAPDQLSALADSRVMPAHEWRYSPNILPVRESVANGQLGEPGLLRIHVWINAEEDPHLLPSFAQVDLAHWLFGETPTHVHRLARDRYLQLHLGFPNDGMALIDVATGRPGGGYYSLHLIGSKGAAYADDHRNAHLLFDESGSRALLHQQNQVLTIENMLREFLRGIDEERAWNVGLRDTASALDTLREVKS